MNEKSFHKSGFGRDGIGFCGFGAACGVGDRRSE